MSQLSTEQRDRLRDSSFAYVDKAGERHLPIHDAEHARNAIARYPRTDFESKRARYAAAKRVVAAAKRHDVEISDDAEVAKAARS